MTGYVAGEDAKCDDDIHLSLSDFAVQVLMRQQGRHPVSVLTYAGKPIKHVNTKSCRGALEPAGIKNFRWHGLRHTWASWLVQNGTPLYDLQEMGGSRRTWCGSTRPWHRRRWQSILRSLASCLPLVTTHLRHKGF